LYPDQKLFRTSIPHISRNTAIIVKDNGEDPEDIYHHQSRRINSSRFITEEQFHQFTSEFTQSLMKEGYTCYQNKEFQHNTNCSSNHQEDCSITSRCFTEAKPDNKVIEDNQLLKHLNFNGLILQAKSQSIQ
jgi:hypothetical protein